MRRLMLVLTVSLFPVSVNAQDTDTARVARDTTTPDARARVGAPPRTVTELLTARFPGLLVYPSSGTTGAGARVRIRGSSSLLGSNQPVVYVDGVLIDAAEAGLTISVGGQAPSRLNDLNPEDIDSIEVVRGPAAGVRYGAEAAHGVILLYTKRARAGPPRLHAYVDEGRLSEQTRWPANFGGVDFDNPEPFYSSGGCSLQAQARGSCAMDYLRAFSPLESRSQFAVGARRQYGLRASAGAGDVRYALGVERETDDGTYELSQSEADRLVGLYGSIRGHTRQPNTLARTSVRGNVDVRAAARTDIALSLQVLSSDLRLPFNDNHAYGLVVNGLRGSSDSTVNDGWWPTFRPGDAFQVLSSQAVDRRVASLRVRSQPLAFLILNAVAGLDDVNQEDLQLQRFGEGPGGYVFGGGGTVFDNRINGTLRTLGLETAVAYKPTAALRASTRFGVRHVRGELDTRVQQGAGLPFRATSIGAAASQFLRTHHDEAGRLTLFVEQELAWRDALTVVSGLRRDDHSGPTFTAFTGVWFASPAGPGLAPGAADLRDTWHPALAVRWNSGGRVGGPFGPMELRAAYGSASVPSRILGTRPERTRETEFAASSALAGGRGMARAVAYDRRSTDVFEIRYYSPSQGVLVGVPFNGAGVTNRGVELQLAARLVDRDAIAWDVALTAWGNRNRVEKLTEWTFISEGQQHRPGFPIGGYWRRPITFNDGNRDGVIELAEITQGDSAVWIGTPAPTRGASLDTRLRLQRWLEVGGLLEYRAGHHLYNQTFEQRCRLGVCRELYDRATPLDRQAAAVAAASGSRTSSIEDADFLKFRELAVTFIAPTSWVGRVRARAVRFTIAGRNVATWTGYSGADPEVNRFGQAGAGMLTADLFTQPPVRFWTARLDVEF